MVRRRHRVRGALLVGVIGVIGATAWLGSAAEPVGAARATCSKRPFVGTVSRTAEPGGGGRAQPAATRATADFRSARTFDFGTGKSYTVYAGDFPIAPEDLGATLTAPAGKVLVTVFLGAADGSKIAAGQTLTVGTDLVSVIVDAGAGAQAVTSNPSGTVKVLAVSPRRLCVRIAYSDAFQTVSGVVSAPIP